MCKLDPGESVDYLREILSFIAGAIAGGITVRWSINKNNKHTSNQMSNSAGGDIAGRDVNKK